MYMLVRFNYSSNSAITIHAYHEDLTIVEALYAEIKKSIDAEYVDSEFTDLLEIVSLSTPFTTLSGVPLYWGNYVNEYMPVIRSNNR